MTARVACIVGPTCSGKSEVADLVALALGSAVISVDAMQVYRGMDIGTAKTPEGQRLSPLLMVDVCDVREEYSVQRFQAAARAEADSLASRGLVPVLCGGTGLYLDAVIDDMSFPAGKRGDSNRARHEADLQRLGTVGLWEELNRRDPQSAQIIHPNNSRRVVRALELLDAGVSYASHHSGIREHRPHYDATIWALSWDRQELYSRIDARVDAMFEGGLVDEVRHLMDVAGLVPDSTAGQAIGYKEVMEALDGRRTLDEAREQVKVRTRRYAKRQLSWLRRDGRVRWVEMGRDVSPADVAGTIVAEVRSAG